METNSKLAAARARAKRFEREAAKNAAMLAVRGDVPADRICPECGCKKVAMQSWNLTRGVRCRKCHNAKYKVKSGFAVPADGVCPVCNEKRSTSPQAWNLRGGVRCRKCAS